MSNKNSSIDSFMESFEENSMGYDYTTHIGDKLTFVGVLLQHCEEICIRWNENTARTYARDYADYICPFVGTQAIDNYTEANYEEVFENIRIARINDDRVFNPNTERHFEVLILKVHDTAVKYGYCKDVMWGSRRRLHEEYEKSESLKASKVKLKKSLSPNEEMRLFNEIMIDPLQSSEKMGLAIMFATGLRENEAVGILYGDIMRISNSDYYALWMYKTVRRDKREAEYGGKTVNANRIVPIPDVLLELINKRKDYLKELGYSNQELKEMPICCEVDISKRKRNGYKKYLMPRHLSSAGKEVMSAARIGEDKIKYINEELNNESLEVKAGIIEKKATSYILRRNFATHLYILGLTQTQIQYIMGHLIEDSNEPRRYMSNDDEILHIAEIMHRRPLLNDHNINIVANDSMQLYNVTDSSITIPKSETKSSIEVRISELESYDEINISCKGIGGFFRPIIAPADYNLKQETNVDKYYRRAYDLKE